MNYSLNFIQENLSKQNETSLLKRIFGCCKEINISMDMTQAPESSYKWKNCNNCQIICLYKEINENVTTDQDLE